MITRKKGTIFILQEISCIFSKTGKEKKQKTGLKYQNEDKFES